MTERGTQTNGQREQTPLSSADAAFDRLIRQVESLESPAPSPRRTAEMLEDALSAWGGMTGAGMSQPRAAAARSLDLVSELMNDALGLLAGFVDSNLSGSSGSSGSAAQVESVTVSGRPGSRAGTAIWVHHQGADRSGQGRPIPLRLTDLFAHDGSRLAGSAGTFAVVAAPTAESGSSQSWLEIEIPSDLPPGVYHGHVLAVGLPDAAINLKLLVEP